MPHPTHLQAQPGAVGLTVAQLDRALLFYQQALGLTLLQRTPGAAALGTARRALLWLEEDRAARPAAPESGLFHVALRLPERHDLARALVHLARQRVPIHGLADHLVSESIYLADPDGIGLELTWDRPPTRWGWDGDQVQIGTQPLDADDLLRALDGQADGWNGMPDGAAVGHLQLFVADLPRAERFYQDLLGLRVTKRFHPVAAFFAAGGYHHHLGCRVGRGRWSPDAVGLRWHTLALPTPAERAALLARLRAAQVPLVEQPNGVLAHDPFGYPVLLTVEDDRP